MFSSIQTWKKTLIFRVEVMSLTLKLCCEQNPCHFPWLWLHISKVNCLGLSCLLPSSREHFRHGMPRTWDLPHPEGECERGEVSAPVCLAHEVLPFPEGASY